MEIYVARQPIFNGRMGVYGYELLYRRSMNNFYEGESDNQSTAEVINNAFLAMQLDELTGSTRAFINFSEDMLLLEIPSLLPKQAIVVEVLERVEVTEKVIEACKKLKGNGYMIALDDFVFKESYIPLIEIADIIKIEFNSIDYDTQSQLIKKYKGKVKFLAEKVETREEFSLALSMGYDYFQGYFFGKPLIVKGEGIEALSVNLISIIDESNKKEPNLNKIIEIIESDLGLSYKLLKLANSTFFGSRNKIYSIKQAIIRMGVDELKKWIYLMMFKEVQCVENGELIKNSLIRGKLMESLANEMGMKNKNFQFFMVGLFSSIDIILNRKMEEILEELPFDKDMKDALLGEYNKIKEVLDIVVDCELCNWEKIEKKEILKKVTKNKFMVMYIDGLKWVKQMEL